MAIEKLQSGESGNLEKMIAFYERFLSQLVNGGAGDELLPQINLEFLHDEPLKLKVSQQTNQLRQVHAFVADLERQLAENTSLIETL